MQGDWRQSPSGWTDFHPAPSLEPGITLSHQGEIIPEHPAVEPEPTQEPYPGQEIDCPYDPKEMAGKPLGMFHCPLCGCMLLAGLPHPKEWN